MRIEGKRIGGKVVGSGGFGCVFRPALKCRGKQRTAKKMISKLMTKKHAQAEYDEIIKYQRILKTIPNYERHFLLNDITICEPDILTTSDLKNFNKKCHALEDDYSAETINTTIGNNLKILNIPDGGTDLKKYMTTVSYADLSNVSDKLLDLLVGGIVEMNKKNVLHADLKDSNILMDGHSATIIDWGLSTTYTLKSIPDRLMNRSMFYNLPFSGILFNNLFLEMHSQTLLSSESSSHAQSTRIFVESFVQEWFNYRGQGHYTIIKRIFGYLFVSDIIDTNAIAMDYIVSYLSAIVSAFTHNGKVDLLKYFNHVYRHIVDIWGFLTTYLSILELLADNYKHLNKCEIKLYNALKTLILTQMYEPRIKPNNIKELSAQIKALNPLFKKCASRETQVDFKKMSESSSTSSNSTSSIKPLTKKHAGKIASRIFSKTRKFH
jgi:serine/threonine protein kinase